MKLLILVGVLYMAALLNAQSEGEEKPRGCISFMGQCLSECPVGTHSYTLGCGYKTPQATCLEPNPVPETAILCDYSACYCNEPTVRDEKTGECVLLENCSPQGPDPCETTDGSEPEKTQ